MKQLFILFEVLLIVLIVVSSWLLMKEHEIGVSHYEHICIAEEHWRGKVEEEI